MKKIVVDYDPEMNQVWIDNLVVHTFAPNTTVDTLDKVISEIKPDPTIVNDLLQAGKVTVEELIRMKEKGIL